MSEIKPKTGISFSISEGKIEEICGERVPFGTVAAIGAEGVSAAGREVTSRAIQMTAGLFRFAEESNRKEPIGEGK